MAEEIFGSAVENLEKAAIHTVYSSNCNIKRIFDSSDG